MAHTSSFPAHKLLFACPPDPKEPRGRHTRGEGQQNGLGARRKPFVGRRGSAHIDMEDNELSTSPFQTLFLSIKPRYASYYEVVDMLRR